MIAVIEGGLCAVCRHVRANTTRRGTTYLRCGLAATDPRFVRYPQLPVLSCPGFQRAADGGPGSDVDRHPGGGIR